MPNQVIQGKSIKGIVPLLDPRTIDKPFIVDGRNFLVDFKGPYSAFSSRLFNYEYIRRLGWVQSFRLEDDTRCFYFLQDCVIEFDTITQTQQIIAELNVDSVYWPWSMALVNGEYFFCKSNLGGVLRIRPTTGEVDALTANVPSGANSVTQSRGRLVVIGDEYAAWSALDDGSDLSPNLTTGAGFQSIRAIIGASPVAPVKEVSDGFIIFTKNGIMKSEFSQGLSIFRHYPLSRSYVPINSFLVVDLQDRNYVFLDRKGLFQTDGTIPKEYEPVFGEYLRSTFLKERDLTDVQDLRLFYDETAKHLYLSVQSQTDPSLYDYAFVFNEARQEWGRFDRQHYAILQVFFQSGANKGFHTAYVDSVGYIHYFVDEIFFENNPTDALTYYYQDYRNAPDVRTENGSYVFGVNLCLSTVDDSQFAAAGFYSYTGAIAPSYYLASSGSLDSWIIVGLFRYTDQKEVDELGLVTNVLLAVDDVPGETDSEDWATTPPTSTEDWSTASPDSEADWGLNSLSGSLFSATIFGTNDGTNTWHDQEEILTLVFDERGNKYYACLNTGFYHTIRLDANAAGESFHLRMLEISGSVAGRL